MGKTIALLVLAAAVAACGDDTEAQLARCKTDVLATFDGMLAVERAKPDAKPFAIKFMEGFGRGIIVSQLSWMSGPAGLAKCREVLAKNRVVNAP